MNASETRAAVGFLKPTERDRCAACTDCGHADNGRDGPWERSWLKCRKHGFNVAGGAICDDYQQRADRPAPPPL